MKYLLFRKISYLGEDYYQLYDITDDFSVEDDFVSFDDLADEDVFYISADEGQEINENVLYTLYKVDGKEIEMIDDPVIYDEVFKIYRKIYPELKRVRIERGKISSKEDVIISTMQEVLFQRQAIESLVNRIYQNHDILVSNLPTELQIEQIQNILFFGPVGSGKHRIVELLEKHLGIPYADIYISTNIEETLSDIVSQLIKRGYGKSGNVDGVVVIRDNYDSLKSVFGSPYEIINYIISAGTVSCSKIDIEFGKLTFIVLLDDKEKLFSLDCSIYDIQNEIGCPYLVSTKSLNEEEKYLALLSVNGRIYYYEKLLNQFGMKLLFDEQSIKELIDKCNEVSPDMGLLNLVIDKIIGELTSHGFCDVRIDSECIKKFLPKIPLYAREKEYSRTAVTKKRSEIEFSLKDVYLEILKRVVGQDEHVKRILYTILENRRMANKINLEDPKQYIQNILIRGESGGGKTFIINTIARLLNIPVFTADATQYTEAGYVGGDITDMLVELYHAAGDDLEAAEKGILVIDEVDKKAGNNGRSGDISRGAVLNGLLKIIEGAKIPVNVGTRTEPEPIIFDTSRLTVICSGAFEGIEKIRDERLRGKRRIGFANPGEIEEEKTGEIIDKDFVEFGMMRQFMARLSVIINLNKNNVQTLIKIMKESSSSKLEIARYKLQDKGIEVEYTDDFYEALALSACKLEIGVRGIEKELERVLTSIHIEDIEPSEVQKIIFTGQVVSDPKAIILVPREKSKVKKLV